MAEVTEAAVLAAMEEIAARMLADLDRLVSESVEYYASSVAEYRALPRAILDDDVGAVTRANFEWFLEHVTRPETRQRYAADVTRTGLTRRARQGVSLAATLRVVRLWGRCAWVAVLDAARLQDPTEQAAALRFAAPIMDFVDGFCAIVEESWLEMARGIWSDEEVARRDLVELLIAGRGASEAAHRRAGHLGVPLAGEYVAVIARLSASEAERGALRTILELVRDHLPGPSGPTISVIRHEEVVAMHPVARFADLEALAEVCAALAVALVGVDAKVGLGTWHPGASDVSKSYDEARQAVTRALRGEPTLRMVKFDDLVLDQLLSSAGDAHPQLEGTLRRLREHDAQSRANLTATLRSYVRTGFSLARTAAELHIHSNTVVYRLRRIHEVTGRDPRNSDDLVILTLALRMGDLTPAP